MSARRGGTERQALAAAVALHRAGRLDEAEALYRRVLAGEPRQADALHLLGVVEHQKGRHGEAVRLLLAAVDAAPAKADYFNHLGMAYKGQGDLAEAVASYARAVALRPGYAEAHYNLGNALLELQRPGEAAQSYRRVLALTPDHAEAWNNLGTALSEQGLEAEAGAAFERALGVNPRYPEALVNLAAKRIEAGALAAAIACYEQALDIDAEDATAATPLLHQYQYACAWDRAAGLEPRVDAMTRRAIAAGEMAPESPFQNVARCMDVALNFEVARRRSADIARRARAGSPSFSLDGRRRPRERLRIGYVSGDFRNHPIAHLCCRLFGLHDRAKMEVIAYSTGADDGSYWRRTIEAGAERFVDLRGASRNEAAARIHGDAVDILVDLMGYTKGNSFAVFALRPAPLQVTWLGFPGTSGADFFDYAVVDRIVVPPAQAPFYSEALAYVRHCYQINDPAEPVAATAVSRAGQGLPAEGVVFCSFNQSYKYDRTMFAAWMRLLAEVPGSVLWLMRLNDLAEPNLRREAAAAGVDPARLIFSPPVPKAEHMARLALADIALDTRIYGGHTSSSDALRAGVPVVTLKGGHFASRVAASILTAMNHSELIAASLEEYEAIALGLARDAAARGRLKAALRAERATARLLDVKGFAADLEDLYRQMWEIYERGEAPRMMAVKMPPDDGAVEKEGI